MPLPDNIEAQQQQTPPSALRRLAYGAGLAVGLGALGGLGFALAPYAASVASAVPSLEAFFGPNFAALPWWVWVGGIGGTVVVVGSCAACGSCEEERRHYSDFLPPSQGAQPIPDGPEKELQNTVKQVLGSEQAVTQFKQGLLKYGCVLPAWLASFPQQEQPVKGVEETSEERVRLQGKYTQFVLKTEGYLDPESVHHGYSKREISRSRVVLHNLVIDIIQRLKDSLAEEERLAAGGVPPVEGGRWFSKVAEDKEGKAFPALSQGLSPGRRSGRHERPTPDANSPRR